MDYRIGGELHFHKYAQHVDAVTVDDINRVAKEYL